MNRARIFQITFACILFAIPIRIVYQSYAPEEQFLGLIKFGQVYEDGALPEIKILKKLPSNGSGYDGQFYAQLALRPTLDDPALEGAIGRVSYRGRRMGLPWLAFLLGGGQPFWVLQIYALLNLVFFALLLGLLWKAIGFNSVKNCLLAISMLWTSGTLVSVARALTDLPATAVGVIAIMATRRWWCSAALLSASAIIKDTSALSFAAIPLLQKSKLTDFRRIVAAGFIVCIPLALWILVLISKFPIKGSTGSGNFDLPLAGLTTKVTEELQEISAIQFNVSNMTISSHWFELLCPLTLAIQAIYLFSKPRISSQYWRFGIGFGVLVFFLGSAVWAEQNAYTRVCLPLTFSFNLLIHQFESGKAFYIWFLIGNLGMCWSMHRILGEIF